MTTEEKEPLWITQLDVESFQRVKVARILPNGSVVKLAGRNRQGKTSILNAIEALLRGPKATPPNPIHAGKLSARTRAFIGNPSNPKQYVIERKYKNGTETLSIKGPDGKEIDKKKQTTLDEIFDTLGFEVSRFLRLEAKDQDAILKEAAGLDFTADDAEYDGVFKARAALNAELKRIQALIVSTERISGAPKEEQHSVDIIAELEEADARELEIRNATAEITDIELGAERESVRIKELEHQIEQLQHEKMALQESVTLRAQKAAEKKAAVALLTPIDKAPIKKRLEELEANNRKVRHNAEIDALELKERATENEIERLEAELERIKAGKAQKLADAKFPVAGLGFDESGPTLNGFPLEQASKREQLELCVALAIQLKPQLRVFIVRDAAVIDEDGLTALAELAEKHGCQLWLEIATKHHDADMVFIEDGEIVDPPVAGASA